MALFRTRQGSFELAGSARSYLYSASSSPSEQKLCAALRIHRVVFRSFIAAARRVCVRARKRGFGCVCVWYAALTFFQRHFCTAAVCAEYFILRWPDSFLSVSPREHQEIVLSYIYTCSCVHIAQCTAAFPNSTRPTGISWTCFAQDAKLQQADIYDSKPLRPRQYCYMQMRILAFLEKNVTPTNEKQSFYIGTP